MINSHTDSDESTAPTTKQDEINPQQKEISSINGSSSSKSRLIAINGAVSLLLALYTVQGSLVSYYGDSLSLLLASQGAEYSDLGILQIVLMPFCIKIFFAPFLDLYYFGKFGKRKTYIVPLLILTAFATICIAFFINNWIENYSTSLLKIVATGFAMQLFNAVQDIANDGWVVTLLNQDNLAKGASSQGAGSTLGGLFGYYFFIPLTSVTFCNKYIFSNDHAGPLLTSEDFLIIVAVCALVLALIILLFVREKSPKSKEYKSVSDIPQLFKGIFGNKNLRLLNIFLLTYPFCLSVIEEACDVVLVRKGMSTEDISNIGLCSLPLTLLVCWFAPKYIDRHTQNVKLLLFAIFIEILANIGIFYAIERFDADTNYDQTWYIMFFMSNLDSCGSILEYIVLTNFIQKITNPEIAAAFITTENVVYNIAWWFWGTLSLFLLQKVDLYVLAITSWIGSVIYLLTFGIYAAKNLDATLHTEFYPQLAKRNIPYSDIPDNMRSDLD